MVPATSGSLDTKLLDRQLHELCHLADAALPKLDDLLGDDLCDGIVAVDQIQLLQHRPQGYPRRVAYIRS